MVAPLPSPDELSVRLVSITTTAMSCVHLQKGQLCFLRQNGVHVTAIASPSLELQQLGEREGVDVVPVAMAREIEPFRDLISLLRLLRLFRHLRPHIVNAGTPKAGLLGMLAARLAGVPIRIYTLRGLRLETCTGWKRHLLIAAERLACNCATSVVYVSHSLRSACEQHGLVNECKAIVIGKGSSNGVNAEHFSSPSASELELLRANLRIPEGVPVIGFVGRLTRDKGIEELWDAFSECQERYPAARLLIVGDFESGDAVKADTITSLKAHRNVVITGFVSDASKYYWLMTVLAFPSHREGFPNVPLEAACVGIPAVGFEATGTIDAIQHGVTGTIVSLRDTRGLLDALETYLLDSSLRERHGQAAKLRALRDFAPTTIWNGLLTLYQEQHQKLHATARSPALPFRFCRIRNVPGTEVEFPKKSRQCCDLHGKENGEP
jgi:glycosyltransferase involved in cell wall biosynthesis